MTREIFLRGIKLRLAANRLLGEGGEAEVFDIRDLFPGEPPKALKIWKLPNHADFQGSDEAAKLNRERVKARVDEYGSKVRSFPKLLSTRVIAPEEIATNLNGSTVYGYTMKLLDGVEPLRQYSVRPFRRTHGIETGHILRIFKDLHATVNSLHRSSVVIGDFNHLNILVKGLEAHIIDTDSMQYGSYLCRIFTSRYVDPLICDPLETKPVQVKPHSSDTDWYAFALMLFECLLFVHPYGGVYMPKNSAKQLPPDARPIHRLSVFNKEVIYPKSAVPLTWLPRKVADYFEGMLALGSDRRGPFPSDLLDLLLAHSEGRHLDTALAATPAVTQAIIRGRAKMERLFRVGHGVIVSSNFLSGKLVFLYHENGEYKREDGTTVLAGGYDSGMHFLVSPRETMVTKGSHLAVLRSSTPPLQYGVDPFQNRGAMAGLNVHHHFWIEKGRLLKDDSIGPKFIGEVLEKQTRFWVGAKFGFGFYRAGGMTVGFTFDTERTGINDSIKIPPIKGELIESTCYFSSNRAWFLTATNEGGKLINRCLTISPDGKVSSVAESIDGDDNWLGSLRGKCAATVVSQQGNATHRLYCATEHGLVAVDEVSNGTGGSSLMQTATYPDTEGFVSTDDTLYFDSQHGFLVVRDREISLLTLS